MKKLLFALFISLFSLCAFAQQEINFIDNDWNLAFEEAKKQNKPVFVDAYTTWCGPCKWMAANIFTNDTVAQFFNSHFINLKMDMEKGEGLTVAKNHEVRYYPTLLYFNAQGELLHRSVGASQTIDNYFDQALKAIHPLKSLSALQQQFEAGNTEFNFLKNYITELNGAYLDASKPLEIFYADLTEADFTNPDVWEVTKRATLPLNHKAIVHLMANDAMYTQKFGEEVSSTIEGLLNNELFSTIRTRNFDETAYFEAKKNVAATQHATAPKIIFYGELAVAERKKDYEQYQKIALAGVAAYAFDDANGLNNIAWTFFEHVKNKKALIQAESWAKRAVELQPEPVILDTYANLAYKNKNKALARTLMQQAIAKLEANNEDATTYIETLNSFK